MLIALSTKEKPKLFDQGIKYWVAIHTLISSKFAMSLDGFVGLAKYSIFLESMNLF